MRTALPLLCCGKACAFPAPPAGKVTPLPASLFEMRLRKAGVLSAQGAAEPRAETKLMTHYSIPRAPQKKEVSSRNLRGIRRNLLLVVSRPERALVLLPVGIVLLLLCCCVRFLAFAGA